MNVAGINLMSGSFLKSIAPPQCTLSTEKRLPTAATAPQVGGGSSARSASGRALTRGGAAPYSKLSRFMVAFLAFAGL